MKNSIYIGLFSLMLLCICSCDYVATPLLPHKAPTAVTTDSVGFQNILVEDYTGMACINCPTMATRIEELMAQYGNRIIPMEVNYGSFADPTQWAAPYNTWDFRSTIGNTYGDLFVTASGSYPNGMVNRRHYPQGTQNIGDSLSLGLVVDSIMKQNTGQPGVYIALKSSFNILTSVLSVTATTTFLSGYTGNYNLVLVLTQDSIQAPQNNRPSPSTNYQHRFALRDNITSSAWGDALVTNPTVNQTFTKTYSYTIPASYQSPYSTRAPIPSNYKQSYVIAYLYDATTSSPTQYQVIQAQKKKIYP